MADERGDDLRERLEELGREQAARADELEARLDEVEEFQDVLDYRIDNVLRREGDD